MDKVIDFGKWLARNFFFVSTSIFIIIYLRWFQLTPLELDGSYNDSNETYIVGLILLSVYILSTVLHIGPSTVHRPSRFLTNELSLFFLVASTVYIFFFFPRLNVTTKCNEKSYYITNNFGTPTSFWTYDQLTVWENSFEHKSIFFGYQNINYQIICDEKQNEVNIITPNSKHLNYTYGEHPRRYLHISTTLNHHLFFISEEWTLPKGCDQEGNYSDCDLYIYTLYKCNSDYKSCSALPVQYSKSHNIFGYLEAKETTNEVYFYDNDVNDPTLIFTYGEYPRCYVEGCEILEESKQGRPFMINQIP